MSILERNPAVESCRLAESVPETHRRYRAEKARGIQGSPCVSPGAAGPLGSGHRQNSITGPAWREPCAGWNKQGSITVQQHGFKVPDLLSQTAAASEAVSILLDRLFPQKN